MLNGKKSIAAVFLSLCWSSAPAADICKYVDEEGRTLYSTAPLKNAKKVVCFKTSAPPPAAEESARREERSVESAPKPKVDGSTQARRDNDRQEILQDELARERRLLEEARQALAEQEASRSGDERNYQRVLDRLKPYQDKVEQHQRNIDSLNKEITNLR
jgi:septal ring factor EnvC (AmiA/AmiB activator)